MTTKILNNPNPYIVALKKDNEFWFLNEIIEVDILKETKNGSE